MTFLALLSLSVKRLRSKLFLSILVVLSFAITIGLMVSVPVFSGGVSRLIIKSELGKRTESVNRPPFSVRFYTLPKTRWPLTLEDWYYNRAWLADMLREHVGLPIRASYMQYQSAPFKLRVPAAEHDPSGEDLMQMRVSLVEELGKHIDVVDGQAFGEGIEPDTLTVWMHAEVAEEIGIRPGDDFDIAYFFRRGTQPIRVRVVGLFEAKDATEEYWYWQPRQLFRESFVTTEEQYTTYVGPLTPEGASFAFWYFVLDDGHMSLNDVPAYIEGLAEVEREVGDRLPDGTMDYSPSEELLRGQERKMGLSDILLSFALPLVGILLSFIGSVSYVVAQSQAREVAVLISRGSSKLQLLLISLVETVIILLLATPLGVFLGLAVARGMGYAAGFLEFVPRDSMPVYVASINWNLVLIGVGAGLVARLIPTFLATRFSIVAYERRAARRNVAAGALRFLLVVFFSAATYYAYRQLSISGPLGLMGLRAEEEAARDPLLLLAPTLFLFTVSYVAAELFLVLFKPLSWVARWIPSTTGYLGSTSLAREGRQYLIPVFLLILCLNLGIFYASLARSADIWLVDRLKYRVGSDLVFEREAEGVSRGAISLGSDSWLLPVSEYEEIEGVSRAARVGTYWGDVPLASSLPDINLIAVDRMDFSDVVYWRDDYASASLGELMNALGATSDGVLVPKELLEILPVGIGDPLDIRLLVGEERYTFSFTIVGTFDYFPTVYYEEDRPALVTSMSYLERELGGAISHGIWMRLEPDADVSEVLRHVEVQAATPAQVHSLSELVEADQSKLERIGIFGMLSVCFLAGAVLSGTELLVYSLAMIRSRLPRFAILRAIGVKALQVIGMVATEYVLVLLYGIGAGSVLGVISSRLFVPYFPLTENPELQVPPFLPAIDWSSAGWLAAAVAVTLVLIEALILQRLMQAEMVQVLRMGNQE